MKNCRLLNSEIIVTIAQMGHKDTIAVADCGLPIEDTTKRIDIALKKGVPTFLETLIVVLDELEPETAILAEEIKTFSPKLNDEILELLGNIKVDYVSHEEFKKLVGDTKACVRTGECTPYANIILVSAPLF